jgi:hypothetical protein
MTTSDTGCLDDFPDIDQTEGPEVVESYLRRTKAGEEELFDLERVEVAVLVEELKDDQVALGE